jgi:hypothetical protein
LIFWKNQRALALLVHFAAESSKMNIADLLCWFILLLEAAK